MDTENVCIRIDLGCGSAKKEGFIGLDMLASPCTDHVLDLTQDKFPFADNSVSHVFSSHFLEHIEIPDHVFSEIGRICREGAKIQLWTPFAFSEEASFYGHLHSFSEKQWMNFCVIHRDLFQELFSGYWELQSIIFIVHADTANRLQKQGFTLDFGIRHLNNVVVEIGIEAAFSRNRRPEPVIPERVWAVSREARREVLRPGKKYGISYFHRAFRKLWRIVGIKKI
jgi:SAM-dependent methyltransferase